MMYAFIRTFCAVVSNCLLAPKNLTEQAVPQRQIRPVQCASCIGKRLVTILCGPVMCLKCIETVQVTLSSLQDQVSLAKAKSWGHSSAKKSFASQFLGNVLFFFFLVEMCEGRFVRPASERLHAPPCRKNAECVNNEAREPGRQGWPRLCSASWHAVLLGSVFYITHHFDAFADILRRSWRQK